MLDMGPPASLTDSAPIEPGADFQVETRLSSVCATPSEGVGGLVERLQQAGGANAQPTGHGKQPKKTRTGAPRLDACDLARANARCLGEVFDRKTACLPQLADVGAEPLQA